MRILGLAPSAVLLACCALLGAAEDGSTQSEDAVPAWALARLRIGALGKSLDRLAAYCDAVQTNTGAIARMTVAAKLFFPMPIEDGMDPDGAVSIYVVPPAIPGEPLEKAMILPLKDATALRDSLEMIYDVTRAGDHLKIAVPQGFDKPEKSHCVRFEDRRVFVASDSETLERLAGTTDVVGGSVRPGAAAQDGALSVNLGALRRQYLKSVEAAAMAGLALLPLGGIDGQSLLRNAVSKSRELETVTLGAKFEDSQLVLSSRIQALPNTPTAMLWSRLAPRMTGARLPLLVGAWRARQRVCIHLVY